MSRAYSIEERLLFDCASVEVDSAGAQRIRAAVEHGVDWSQVATLAERHRITPLVCRTLEDICHGVFDLPGAAILKSRTRFIAERNLQLTREMLSLVKYLESQGIVSIPLKGPVLAMAAYGSLSRREFGDLDLLVQPKDLTRACSLLTSLNYEPELTLRPRQRASYIRWQHAFTFQRERDGVVVELHWRLHDRYLSFPLAMSKLWAEVEAKTIFGLSIRCLKPEHNFIFLCMHGAKHYWERMEWISCLSALARVQPPDRWPLIIDEAAHLRSTRLLHLGLRLADDLSSSPATRLALHMMQFDPAVEELTATVWGHIFADEIEGAAKEVYRLRFYLKAREHLYDRIHLVWSSSVRIPHPQSSTWSQNRLPDSLMFLYYLLRPLTLLRKFGLRGLRGVLRA